MTDRTAILAEIDAEPANTEVKARAKGIVLRLPDDIPSPYVMEWDDVPEEERPFEIALRWGMVDWEEKSFTIAVSASGYEVLVVQNGEADPKDREVLKFLAKPHVAILREMLKEPEPPTKETRK